MIDLRTLRLERRDTGAYWLSYHTKGDPTRHPISTKHILKDQDATWLFLTELLDSQGCNRPSDIAEDLMNEAANEPGTPICLTHPDMIAETSPGIN